MLDLWALAAILTKLLLYIGLITSTGLLIIAIVFSDLLTSIGHSLRKQTLYWAVLALVAAVLGYMLRGAALTGDVDGMLDPEILALLWQTPAGDALAWRLCGISLLLLGACVRPYGHWCSLLGGVLALWSFTQVGHVASAERWLLQGLLWLHLLGVSFWLGVLSPLHQLARDPGQLSNAAQLGHRFGQCASFIVPALIVVGGCMAWLLVGSFELLLSSAYGQVLLIKVLLVGSTLLLAAANKWRFVPAMQKGSTTAAAHLTRAIQAEGWVILLVLLLTATLTSVLTFPT